MKQYCTACHDKKYLKGQAQKIECSNVFGKCEECGKIGPSVVCKTTLPDGKLQKIVRKCRTFLRRYRLEKSKKHQYEGRPCILYNQKIGQCRQKTVNGNCPIHGFIEDLLEEHASNGRLIHTYRIS